MKLSEIAARLGCPALGDAEVEITGVASLDDAGPHDLSYVRSLVWAEKIARTRAGALVLPAGVDALGRPAIVSPNPGADFARAVAIVAPPARPPAGVHVTAFVDPSARVQPGAAIGAHAIVGARSSVGARTTLHPNVTLYDDVVIGEDCEIHAGCVLREGTRLGRRVILHPGVALGGDGFGYALVEGGTYQKVPQVGRVAIEDDVEIGANTTVDRASLGETRIRRGAKIDNLVQIAHGCDVGEDVVIAAQTALAGGTIIERGAVLMGRVVSAGHLRIGAKAFIGGAAGLTKDVPAGARMFGVPAMEGRLWHRVTAALQRLPDLLKRVRALERHLGLRGTGDAP